MEHRGRVRRDGENLERRPQAGAPEGVADVRAGARQSRQPFGGMVVDRKRPGVLEAWRQAQQLHGLVAHHHDDPG